MTRSDSRGFRTPFWIGLGAALLALIVYSALTAKGGVPDPTDAQHMSHGSVVLNSALLVFREGLEAVLIVAAITASFLGADRAKRRPVGIGVGIGLVASVATWFLAAWVLGQLGGPGLDIQAATGLLAVIVLLVVMNWFFHNVYWTGWIAHHHRRRRKLLSDTGRGVTIGLLALGFTAVYREGFEVVLFLQSMRLQYGAGTVLEGVALGLLFTAAVGVLTFVAHRRLPYKKMLILTGVTIGFVLFVMVGEGVQEMQLAGWIPTSNIGVTFPGWIGTWLAIFPTWETLGAQVAAIAFSIGSYLLAEHLRVRKPQREGAEPARRPESPPEAQPVAG